MDYCISILCYCFNLATRDLGVYFRKISIFASGESLETSLKFSSPGRLFVTCRLCFLDDHAHI